jgi:hypothetical protein
VLINFQLLAKQGRKTVFDGVAEVRKDSVEGTLLLKVVRGIAVQICGEHPSAGLMDRVYQVQI